MLKKQVFWFYLAYQMLLALPCYLLAALAFHKILPETHAWKKNGAKRFFPYLNWLAYRTELQKLFDYVIWSQIIGFSLALWRLSNAA